MGLDEPSAVSNCAIGRPSIGKDVSLSHRAQSVPTICKGKRKAMNHAVFYRSA